MFVMYTRYYGNNENETSYVSNIKNRIVDYNIGRDYIVLQFPNFKY